MTEMEAARMQMTYDAHRKSVAVAYLLWFFLGGFGAHRFYLGHAVSGAAMLGLSVFGGILAIVLIGIPALIAVGIWWVVDAFLIPGMARVRNLELADALNGGGVSRSMAGPARVA